MPEYCEIKIRGQLGQYWSEWFSGLKLTHLEDDVCLLSGTLPDQAALHGTLERIRDLNLTLISVASRDSSGQAAKADSSADGPEEPTGAPEGAVDSTPPSAHEQSPAE